MNLCLDFGNTYVKASIFNNREEVYYYRDFDISVAKVESLTKEYPIKTAIISSTRNLDKEYLHQVRQKIHLIQLNEDVLVPIKNLYQTPKTLGRDRLAGVVAAHALFPDENCVVIDAGTCITMDFIDKGGNYHGGNISPGISMRRQAMNDFTDKLPLVPFEYPEDFIGKNTTEALQNGILRGTIYEIETFIDSVSAKYGKTHIIFTGGDTKFFEEHLKFPIFAAANLVLVGLNEILLLHA